MGTIVWFDLASGLLAASAGAVFVVGYGVLAPWYRSALGRFMMAQGAVILGLGAHTAAQLLPPSWDGWLTAVHATLMAVLGALLWSQAVAVLRAQLDNKGV